MESGFILDASKKILQNGGDIPKQVRTDDNRKRKAKMVQFPEKKIDELKTMYSVCVVRDFGDDYHLTDSERKSRFDLYELFAKVAKHKTRYNNIVDYVNAMRDCHELIVAMANKNRLVMSPNEFIEMVYKGQIEMGAFDFPVYKGKDRKDINWSNVRKYILDNSLDPQELSGLDTVSYLPKDIENNPEEYLNEFFSESQLDTIFNYDLSNRISSTISYDEDIDSDKRDGVVLPIKKKQMKGLMQSFPDLIRPIKNIAKSAAIDNSLHEFAYELDQSAFEYISKLDRKRGFMASDKIPEFHGDLSSKTDVKRYLYQLDEFQEDYERISYNGSFITLAKYKEEILKEELDRAGWNIMKIYSNEKELKKKEREDKKDKKKEKRLRRKLSEIEKRKERRNSNEDLVNHKKKKPKKSQKKKIKALDNILTSVSDIKAKDFKDYEEIMMDMSYDYEGE